MEARRRAAADAVSRRNAAYPAGGDVLDTVFNRILLASSVCPSSAVLVRESAVLVRLDPPQHTPVSSAYARAGTCIPGGYQSGSSLQVLVIGGKAVTVVVL